MSRRVVVTGLGCVTPLGNSVKESWRRLLQADSNGITKVRDLKNSNEFQKWESIFPESLSVGAVQGLTQLVDEQPSLFSSQDGRRMSSFIKLAVLSSYEALTQAGLINHDNLQIDKSKVDPDRFGCLIGSGIGSIADIYETSLTFDSSPKRNKVNPYFVPRILTNMAAGNIAIKFNLRGPLHSVSTACATGNNAIGDGYNMIKLGMQDICLAGASEASVHPLSLAGFLRAKSITLDGVSRPFDKNRSGFVLGEGSGVIVMESLESAQKRNANILAEIVGYGMSCDAHHITSPPENGEGASRAMKMSIDLSHRDAQPEEIDYVNAHATSTKLGDAAECRAIQSTLIEDINRERPVYVSSNKGSMGHLLGAAGAVESIFTILSLYHKTVPHTNNLTELMEGFRSTQMQFVRDKPVSLDRMRYALCNSFGFGGVNTAILFKRWED